jgi:hypothetical protein
MRSLVFGFREEIDVVNERTVRPAEQLDILLVFPSWQSSLQNPQKFRTRKLSRPIAIEALESLHVLTVRGRRGKYIVQKLYNLLIAHSMTLAHLREVVRHILQKKLVVQPQLAHTFQQFLNS